MSANMQEELNLAGDPEGENGTVAEQPPADDDRAAATAEPEAGQLPPDDSGGEDGNGQDSEEDELTPEKFSELRDFYLRALADEQNSRKIAEKNRLEAIRFGASGMARDLLPIHDNLKRALASVDDVQREHSGALIEGIELTLRELLNMFGRHGVMSVEPDPGDKFDPKLHQAMFEAASADIDAGLILQVMEEGFTMHERLLRPANVGVSSGAPASNVKVEQEVATRPAAP